MALEKAQGALQCLSENELETTGSPGFLLLASEEISQAHPPEMLRVPETP